MHQIMFVDHRRETYRKWIREVMSMPGVADTSEKADVRKVLDISTCMFVIMSHAGLEPLISGWSVEMHTFIIAWREFIPHWRMWQ